MSINAFCQITNTSRTCLSLLSGIFILLLMAVPGYSQSYSRTIHDGYTPTGVEQGGAPAGAYSLSGFENVNLFNGNLNIALPLLKIGGRGTAGYTMMLQADLHWSIYRAYENYASGFFQDNAEFRAGRTWSAGYSPGFLMGMWATAYPIANFSCSSPPFNYYSQHLTRLSFIAPDGSEILLHDKKYQGLAYEKEWCSTGNATLNRGKVFVSADGESITFISNDDILDNTGFSGHFYPSGHLLMKDGTRYQIENGNVTRIRDRNGNQISLVYQSGRVTSITDSLNRVVSISYANTSTGYDEISFNGFSQAPRSIKVWYNPLTNIMRPDFTIQQARQLFPEVYPSGGLLPGDWYHNPTLVSKVELPDERSYQFRYNKYGEVARVILPTGGGFDYDYDGYVPNGTGGYQNTYGLIIYRRVTKRTTFNALTATTDPVMPPAGAREKIENYILESSMTNPVIVRAEQRDSGGILKAQSKHYFYGTPIESQLLDCNPVSYSWWASGKKYKTESFNVNTGVATAVLIKNESAWSPSVTSFSASDCSGAPAPNPTIVEVVTTFGDTNQVTKRTFSYGQYNNQTDIYEYDFGLGQPGALIRRTHTDFLASGYDIVVGGINNPDPVATIHIRSLPTQQSVYDSNGVERTRTAYEYDATPLGALVDRAGITGLVSRSGQAAGAGYAPTSDLMRGNPTKVTRWLLATTGPVAADTGIFSSSQYDVAGNIVKTRDSNNNDTTFDYSDSFSGSFTPNTFAFLKSTISPIPIGPYGGGMALVSTSVYDFASGKVVQAIDPNLKSTTFEYNDPLDRLTKVFRPSGGGMTEYQYGDTPGGLYLRTLTQQSTGFGGVTLTDYALFDGLGRATRSAHYEGSDFSGARWSVGDTRYDALGRVSQVSNPEIVSDYNAALPGNTVWTTTTYDALSRVIEVTTPDNAKVKTTYLGNQVTVEDQANRKRSSITDGLGRLTQVNEAPNDPTNYNYQTNYTYDVLGNLIRVRQGGFPTGGSPDPTVQFRRFYYDSLSRLVYANNPEQNATIAFNPPGEAGTMWTMAYVYDNNGNLTGRTDARNVTTTYAYDALNRNTTINYSDTPTISSDIERFYDTATNGKGRLQRVVSNLVHPGSASRVDSRTVINGYDDLGRVISQTQGFLKSANNWQDYTVSRTYDLASHVKTQTFPLGGSPVTYGYGAGGRTSSFEGFLGGQGYFLYSSGMVYNAAGQMTEEVFGTSPTPIYHTARYNNRFQMYEVNAGTFNDVNNTASSAYWNRGRLRFFYNQAALNAEDPSLAGTDNNGNVLRQEHWVPTATQTNQINAALSNVTQYAMPMRDDYFYDPINRITKVEGRQRTASAYPGQGVLQSIYQQAYSYDKFGNRKLDMTQTWGNLINGSAAADIYDVDKPTNRLKGMIYDAAGNLVKTKPISPQPENRVYDAENRMITATVGATSHYVYDGDGRRVRRILPTGEFWQVYGIDGELLAEYQWNGSAASLKKEYGYRDGQLLVVADPTETNANKRVQWLIADHLGTPRMVVDKTGSLSGVTRHDYLPFGEELMVGMGNGSIRSAGMGYQADSMRQKFTGYERDSETGLDFAQARYFSNLQGRFISPDEFNDGPVEVFGEVASSNPTFYAVLANPQSLNKYQYTYNNPLSYTDPTGHCPDCSPVAAAAAGKEFPNSPVTKAQAEYVKGVTKEVLNVVIDMNNIGAVMINRPNEIRERYRPSNASQELGMQRGAQLMVLLPALGKAGPANVMMAESERVVIISTKINGVRVTDKFTGAFFEGTVDLTPTLNRISSGQKFPHKNDGGIFQNLEGLLPNKPTGYYTEYVVPTPGIKGPGPQRIVTGQGGEFYYTPDHYKTFIRLNH